MKLVFRSLLAIGLLGGWLLAGAPQASAAPVHKTVLVLFPFQPDLSVSKLALQTLQDEFGSVADLDLTVYYEFMDSNRFADSAYQQQLFDLYAAKYAGLAIDLVMIETETTLRVWLQQRDAIAPNAPVVYFDTLSETFADWQLPPDVTGVGGVLDYIPSVEWIMRARPAVNEVVLIHGVGPIDLVPDNIQPINALVQAMGDKVHITDWSALPLPEVKRRVAMLPPTAVVLYHPVFQDAAGNDYNPLTVLREVAALASVPVIVGFDTGLGSGTIGGNMYSLERQTQQAAQIGLRILRGEAASAIPRLDDQSGPFIFDHLALQRFGIPLSALPPDSLIKNRQFSFWELYQPQIIATGVGVGLLLLLVIFLLGVTRQLNRTRLALANLNVNLETQVQDRTALLNQVNRRLQDEIVERQQLEDDLQRQATTDGLTGIANRRRFMELLQLEVEHALRLNYPLAIALIDLDHFKLVNDHYGHAAGDLALAAFVSSCQKNIRGIDKLARLGGDEFALLLPTATGDQAQEVLERVRRAFVTLPVTLGGEPVALTISVGITTLAGAHDPLDEFLARADHALYQAKDAGRNRVVVVRASS